MELKNLKIGLGISGSFCNFDRVKNIIQDLKEEGAEVLPIVSDITKNESTRFYKKEEFIDMLEKTSKNKVIDSILKAEHIGPKNMTDLLIICPCTGNTLAKINNGIADTSLLMATKSHMRNNKPVVIGISTNDGLGKNFKNIAELINTKNIYFVPFNQDDYINKPKSLALDYNKIIETAKLALEGKQIQPVIYRIE